MANSCRIFIGGLGDNCSRNELEREFEHIGRMRDVWVARNPPGFGFIIFEDQRDASDAVREMDGRRVCGQRVRVEMARDPNDRSRNPRRNEKCYSCGKVGHISRECRNKEFGGPPRRGRSRSRSTSRTRRRVSRSRSRSVERKRSRSRSRDRRSPSNDRRRSPSQERRKSPERRSRSRSASHHSN